MSPTTTSMRKREALGAVALVCLWFLCIVGGCGRTEADTKPTLRHRPQRIVSQVVTSDEILWGLGSDVRARVAGVSSMADDPTYSGVAHTWPQTVARIAGTSEALVAASPDLVIVA
jgi:ABC-type Fe2+-enterobactin transport system substrate-binding protein